MDVPKGKPDPMPRNTYSLSSVRNDGDWRINEFTLAVIMVVIIVVGVLVFNRLSPRNACQQYRFSQACIDQRFDECMATEKYSRSECIQLVGENK